MLQSLNFWKNFSWQRNVLFLALAGMEIAWLAPFVMSLHRRSWSVSPLWYLLGLGAVMVGMMALANYLSERQVDSPAFELSVLAAIVVAGLLILRLYVFWGEPLLSLDWLAAAFLGNDPRRLETLLVLVTLAFLWWRGVTFLQRQIGFFLIGYDFRKGVLALIAGISVYYLFTGRSPLIFVYMFFFFSLVAVSVGRSQDKAQVSGGVGRPFGPEWVGIVSLTSLAVLGLAAIASTFWSVQGFSALGRAVAPSTSVLGRVFQAALIFFFRLVGPLLEWLIEIIRNFLLGEGNAINLEIPQSMEDLLGAEPEGVIDPAVPGWLNFVFQYVLPTLLLLLGLMLLVWWLDRRRRQRRGADEGETAERVSGLESEGLAGLARSGWHRLRELAGLAGQFGLGRRFYAAISVRNIYANLQKLSAQRGYPRHPAQTPYDFLPVLGAAFPGHTADLQVITDAYNAVEYGEVPTGESELERLRAAWDAVKTSNPPPSLP